MAYSYWKPDAAAFYADPNLDAGTVRSGATITQLVDLSGNSGNFGQLNSEALPTRVDVGGVYYANFDGASQIMVGPTPLQLGFVLDTTEDLRISIVGRWNADPSGASDRIFTIYEGAGSTKGRVRHESTGDQVQGTWDASVYGGAVAADTTYIYQIHKVGTTVDFLINGTIVASTTAPAAAFQTGDSLAVPTSLGGFVDASQIIGNLFNGKVGAWVIEVGTLLDPVKLMTWLQGWRDGTLVDGQLREGEPDPPAVAIPVPFALFVPLFAPLYVPLFIPGVDPLLSGTVDGGSVPQSPGEGGESAPVLANPIGTIVVPPGAGSHQFAANVITGSGITYTSRERLLTTNYVDNANPLSSANPGAYGYRAGDNAGVYSVVNVEGALNAAGLLGRVPAKLAYRLDTRAVPLGQSSYIVIYGAVPPVIDGELVTAIAIFCFAMVTVAPAVLPSPKAHIGIAGGQDGIAELTAGTFTVAQHVKTGGINSGYAAFAMSCPSGYVVDIVECHVIPVDRVPLIDLAAAHPDDGLIPTAAGAGSAALPFPLSSWMALDGPTRTYSWTKPAGLMGQRTVELVGSNDGGAAIDTITFDLQDKPQVTGATLIVPNTAAIGQRVGGAKIKANPPADTVAFAEATTEFVMDGEDIDVAGALTTGVKDLTIEADNVHGTGTAAVEITVVDPASTWNTAVSGADPADQTLTYPWSEPPDANGIYVAPAAQGGSDANNGLTKGAPKLTFAAGWAAAQAANTNLYLWAAPGTEQPYYVTAGVTDTGDLNGKVLDSYGGGKAVISGCTELAAGWSDHPTLAGVVIHDAGWVPNSAKLHPNATNAQFKEGLFSLCEGGVMLAPAMLMHNDGAGNTRAAGDYFPAIFGGMPDHATDRNGFLGIHHTVDGSLSQWAWMDDHTVTNAELQPGSAADGNQMFALVSVSYKVDKPGYDYSLVELDRYGLAEGAQTQTGGTRVLRGLWSAEYGVRGRSICKVFGAQRSFLTHPANEGRYAFSLEDDAICLRRAGGAASMAGVRMTVPTLNASLITLDGSSLAIQNVILEGTCIANRNDRNNFLLEKKNNSRGPVRNVCLRNGHEGINSNANTDANSTEYHNLTMHGIDTREWQSGNGDRNNHYKYGHHWYSWAFNYRCSGMFQPNASSSCNSMSFEYIHFQHKPTIGGNDGKGSSPYIHFKHCLYEACGWQTTFDFGTSYHFGEPQSDPTKAILSIPPNFPTEFSIKHEECCWHFCGPTAGWLDDNTRVYFDEEEMMASDHWVLYFDECASFEIITGCMAVGFHPPHRTHDARAEAPDWQFKHRLESSVFIHALDTYETENNQSILMMQRNNGKDARQEIQGCVIANRDCDISGSQDYWRDTSSGGGDLSRDFDNNFIIGYQATSADVGERVNAEAITDLIANDTGIPWTLKPTSGAFTAPTNLPAKFHDGTFAAEIGKAGAEAA